MLFRSKQKETRDKLKEQLNIRDVMLKKLDNKVEIQNRSDILSYNDLVEKAKGEQRMKQQFPNAKRLSDKTVGQIIKHKKNNEILSTKRLANIEKRSSSVISQNSSPPVPSMKIPVARKNLSPIKYPETFNTSKATHKKLVNAGKHILMGPKKFYINQDGFPFTISNDKKYSKMRGIAKFDL